MQGHDVWENQVRFEETDQQGIVFYGNYVTFQDETFSAFLRKIGYDYKTLEANGWDIHVVHTELDYHAPAGFEDVLVHSTRIDAIRESSMDFEYAARRKDNDELIVEGSMTHVAVDAEEGSPTRIPDAFRDAVVAFQDEAPDPI